MAVCNLFKKLSNNTGEFLMFSQYAEDLTHNNAQGYKYRVVPSRFIAADIDFSKFKYNTEDNLNISLPTYLQNYFENGCAVCKNNDNIKWDPTISSNLFWNAMIKGGLITVVDNSSSNNDNLKHYIKEFKYINEINIQSYDVIDGMGYSEIYCYIPNTAKYTKYGCSSQSDLKTITTINTIVEGYNESDFVEGMLDWKISKSHEYHPNKSIEFQFDKDDYSYEVQDDDKFNINCIIVLYDINSSDDEGNIINLYKNIPLGLYLPGSFEGAEVKNPITKWVQNNDIYDSGTSYGIRICSRFSTTSNYDTLKTVEVRSVDSDEYATLCQVMGKVSDNLDEMMNVVKDAVFESTALKDTFAMFKNSRTNVPYPVELYGKNYWFVNGRNTGIVIPDGDPYNAYSEDDIKNALIAWDGVDDVLILKVYTINKDGESAYIERIYPTGDQPKTDVLVRWDLINKYTLESISIDKLVLYHPDETYEELDPKTQIFTIHDIVNDGRYELKAIWNMEIDGEITENELVGVLDFKFCLPIYFGLISGGIDAKSSVDSTDLLINKILNGSQEIQAVSGMNKYILPTQYNRVSFKSEGNRIVYAYPTSYAKLGKILNLNSMDDCLHDFTSGDELNKEPAVIKVKFPSSNGGTEEIDYYMYYTVNSTGVGVETIFDFTDENRTINDSFVYE